LPTPTGWTTMGEVQVGDWLLGADGRPTQVVAATDITTDRPCYEVVFDDRTRIVADAEHQWLTTSSANQKPAYALADADAAERPPAGAPAVVLTTREIAETRRLRGDGYHHAVPVAGSLDLPRIALPVPPYVLGARLGAGDYSEPASLAGPAQGPVGAVRDRHIPVRYLRASREQRAALLAGLLDRAGTVDGTGSIRLSVTAPRLAAGIKELVASLGYRCCVWHAKAPSRDELRVRAEQAPVYTIIVTAGDDVFGLRSKRLGRALRKPARTIPQARQHQIVRVHEVASVPVRCVQVDAADSLYLASRSMIPTHNSALALDICRAASVKGGLTSVLFSLEMSRNEITMRLLSAEARVPLHAMRTGQLGEDDWTRLARRMSEVVDAPLFIDDSPNMSMMEIRSKCRRLKQRNDLRLVVVDYLQLMSSPKRVENRQQEVSDLSRSLKLLAKELGVPVVALAQLNRGPELRTDKRPLLADLRESGSIEQDSDVVILLHREDAYERESPRAGEADLIVAKHRNGPTATVTVAFQGHYSRFVDMAPI
jgi:replicative DNA helicase